MKRLDAQRIRPACRSSKGELMAFYEMCDKLREEYSKRCHQDGGQRVTFELQLLVDDPDERGVQGD